MDISTSSEELDTSIESFSSGVPEGTHPLRPSPFTLRSQCASGKCPEGAGILFRSRISPSPSKSLKRRRRRRSDQHNHNRTGDSEESFLELSQEEHDHSHRHSHGHSHKNGHTHGHHHRHSHHHHHHHYPHDGIHNIDHHHVHVQDSNIFTPPRVPTKIRAYSDHHHHHHHHRQNIAEISAEEAKKESYQRTLADILFEELEEEEKQNKLMALKKKMQKERTSTTSETTVTTVRRTTRDPNGTAVIEPSGATVINSSSTVIDPSTTVIDPSTSAVDSSVTDISHGDKENTGSPQVGINGNVVKFARSVKDTVIGLLTPSKQKEMPAIVESSESGFEDGIITGSKATTHSTPVDRFIPARAFFSERDTRDRLTSDYFSGSDTPSKLRESTRRLSIRKPFNQYIAYSSDEEFEDWKHQPKSDYTYSASLTYREQVTPDRKIGSPNMSRRTLKGGSINFVGTSDFSSSDIDVDGANTLGLRSRTIAKHMDVYSDTSDAEEIAQESFQARNRRSTRSRSTDILPRSNGSITRTITTTSTAYTTTKTLHTGLDTESDVDETTEQQSSLPLRATPLTARGGTPLGRSTTPISNYNSLSRRSSSTSVFEGGKGYKLGENTIAEDVEEEEENVESKNFAVRWSRSSWEQITRITTIITASLAIAAASVVNSVSPPKEKVLDDIDKEKAASRKSFMSSVTEKRIRIITTITESFSATRERLKKNPLLIWIPLLLILLLLGLAAYWWLLQSRGQTAGASDPTENDESSSVVLSFLSLISDFASWLSSSLYSLISDFASWLSSSLYSLCSIAWVHTVSAWEWLVNTIAVGLAYIWASLLWLFACIGDTYISFISLIGHCLIILFEYIKYFALIVSNTFTSATSHFVPIVANTFTSASSNLYALIFASNSEDSDANADEKVNQWSMYEWLSAISLKEHMSKTQVWISQSIESSQTNLWIWWIWLVNALGEGFQSAATYTSSLFSYLLSLLIYLVVGLWDLLSSIFMALMSTAYTVSSVASGAPAAIVQGAKLYVLPLFQSSKSDSPTVIVQPPTPEKIVSDKVVFKEGTVEEIIQKVIASDELKVAIAAAVAENSKDQLTQEAVSAIAMSVVDKEFTKIKEDTLVFKSEMSGVNAEYQSKLDQLQEEKANLIKKLEELGQRLFNIESTVEVNEVKSFEDREQNEKKIEDLVMQMETLRVNQEDLVVDVKNCCDGKKMPLILGEIFGIMPNGTTEGNADGEATVDTANIGAWLRSYFVAKTELESRLNDLISTMQMKSTVDGEESAASIILNQEATISQTKQLVMDAVMEKLRTEMLAEVAQSKTSVAEEVKNQITEEVNEQMKVAAGTLGEQVSELQKNVKESIKTEILNSIPEVVESKINAAVHVELQKEISSSVEEAVSVSVEKAVDSSVKIAIDSAVPSAVSAAVNVATDSMKQEVVEKVLPVVVSDHIQVAVEEHVASVLPSVVSSTVNETVTSAVSEAMVHVSVNKAGDESMEGKQSTVNEIVGVVGSASANVSFDSNGNPIYPSTLTYGLNESTVLKIVNDALRKYDADKTGMVDHALETAGGNIVSTRCTESYQTHQAEYSILGIPIYRYSTNEPRTIIQPASMPGQCWAFKGSQGYIVIQLAGPVRPTGFTMEHISKSLSPNGAIDSAPREFEVWGLNTERDEGIFLGRFEYEDGEEPLQYFSVARENSEYFNLIELKINSNHGNIQYTCLYRFRVHGLRLL